MSSSTISSTSPPSPSSPEAESVLEKIESHLLQEQQAISELVHYVSMIPSSHHQNNSSSTNSMIKEQNSRLKQEIANAENDLRQRQNLLASLESSSSPRTDCYSCTPQTISEMLFKTLPETLLHEHELLSQTLFLQQQQKLKNQFLITASDDKREKESSSPLRQQQHPLLSEISKLSQDISDFYTHQIEEKVISKENEIRNKRIRDEEDQARVVLVQLWHKETSSLLEKVKSRATNINSRGSELQHTLSRKREELQRANQELGFAEENLREYYNSSSNGTSVDGTNNFMKMVSSKNPSTTKEDKTAEILLQLQNQFSDLQSELHLRPTHAESGLERLREQIVALSQELTKNKILLSEATTRDESDEVVLNTDRSNPRSDIIIMKGGVMSMKQELLKIENMRKMKKELEERISSTRELIESNQKMILEELNIEQSRRELISRQNELSKEVEMLRDRLLTDDEDDEEDEVQKQEEEDLF